MDSTTQWSISWTTALRPPQEMLPPENLFRAPMCNSSMAANSEHLFGFTPCIPSLCTENSTSTSSADEINDTVNIDSVHQAYEVYEAHEDFQAVLAVEKYTFSL